MENFKTEIMQRAFLYGDFLFESIRVQDGIIQHADKHFNRLMHGSEVLKFILPSDFNQTIFTIQIELAVANFLKPKIENQNSTNCFRVRYVLFRDSKGLYLPNSNTSNYTIDVEELLEEKISTKIIGIFKQQKKHSGVLSNLKTGNALIYVMASIWAKENGFDDALILNEHNRIVEASSSNIFWIKDKQYFTPPLSEGCVAGVMREVLLEQNSVIEKFCTKEDLRNADEIILTNAIQGKVFAELTS